MEIYRLSPLGYKLAHTVSAPPTPGWRVIHYLAQQHTASKEQIIANCPGVNSLTLMKLRQPRGKSGVPIIIEESGVSV